MSIPGPTPAWSHDFSGPQVNTTAISGDGSTMLTGTYQYGESGDFAVYAFDAGGQDPSTPVWSDPLDHLKWGVNWVAVSGDGSHGAAGGLFVRAYSMSDGSILLKESFKTRVNELELSHDGGTLAVAAGDAGLRLYTLSDGAYEMSDSATGLGYVYSVDVSDDGTWIVIGLRDRSTLESRAGRLSDSGGGAVYLYENRGGTLVETASWLMDADVLKAVISADGQWWSATTTYGGCLLYNQAYSVPDGKPVWVYEPVSSGASYAVDITVTQAGDVLVAMGANAGASGSVSLLTNEASSDPSGYTYKRLWSARLDYDPNPNIRVSADGTQVAASDGQPTHSGETPGNFYLFDGTNGRQLWKYSTTIMNWGLAMNPAGTALFGGSDDGSVYFWGA